MKVIRLMLGLLTVILSLSVFAKPVADPNPCLYFSNTNWLMHVVVASRVDPTDIKTLNYNFTISRVDSTGAQGNYTAYVSNATEKSSQTDVLAPEVGGTVCTWGGPGYSNFSLVFMWANSGRSQQLMLNSLFPGINSFYPLTNPAAVTFDYHGAEYQLVDRASSYMRQLF